MEKFMCKQNCKIGYFQSEIREGQEFNVLRSVMGECVLINSDAAKPNIIAGEDELKKYGVLSGTPAFGGV